MNRKKLSTKEKIKFRIRKKISGTASEPRLTVYRSNAAIYAQLIDDEAGVTIASASSKQKDIGTQKGTKSEISKMVGESLAKKAGDLGVKKVKFDRNGYIYHGRVKAVAEGAREAGLEF